MNFDQPSPLDALSVVIPAFNEAVRLGATLERVLGYLAGHAADWEVVVVDDGSTDATAGVAARAGGGDPRLVVLANGHNRGKGYSTRAGALAARHPWVLLSDADLSTPIEEVERLAAAAGPRTVAIASRAAAGADVQVHQAFHRELMGKTFNRIVRLLVLPGIADTQCGFKLFPRAMVQAVFPDLATEGFAFDVEVLARARRAGFAVVEVPVVWRNDARTRVRAGRDSLAMLADVVRLAWRLRRPTG